MKYKPKMFELLIDFCVCTTCITLLEGVMGMLFFPDQEIYYDAFFSPPLFGTLSVLLGFVTNSKKELTVKQVMFRRVLHLLLIEGLVFGLNYLAGVVFPPVIGIALALGIAVVFVMVYVITWINDQKSAEDFNQKLKEFQADIRTTELVYTTKGDKK